MLHLPETDLKQTRFYQEVFREDEEIGEKRGESRGVKKGELSLVLRQLKRRLGGLTSEQQRQVEALEAERHAPFVSNSPQDSCARLARQDFPPYPQQGSR